MHGIFASEKPSILSPIAFLVGVALVGKTKVDLEWLIFQLDISSSSLKPLAQLAKDAFDPFRKMTKSSTYSR